jgi:glycosyltransferase involved in cell wall biosynthesis
MNKKRIVVDARIIGTGTGNYAEGVLDELQKIDKFNDYIIVLDPAAKWRPSPKAKNFIIYSSKNTARVHTFFLRGNVNLAYEIYKLKADVFWATYQFVPYFFRHKNIILTVHDLTQLRIGNVKSMADKKEAWKNNKLGVIKDKIRKLPFSLLPNSLLIRILNFFGIRSAVKRAKKITVTSKYVRDDVVDYFKIKDKDSVFMAACAGVILGKDQVKHEQVSAVKGKDFLFYIGTDFAHKNLGILLDAMLVLKKTKPELQLVFAGKKDRNYLAIEERAEGLGLEDNIHVLGFVSEGQKLWLFKNAKLYVFPSLSEGFGIPALEAMAYGLPVVASNKTAIPEVCGDAAAYFDPEDPDSIAKTILNVLGDEKLRARMIKEGYNRNQFYNWSDSARAILNGIESL